MSVFPDFDVMNEIRDLQEYFTTAHAQLLSGNVIDMSGVEERISRVCKAAQQATQDKQQAYLPELTVLIDLLNKYEKDLRAAQAALTSITPQGNDNGGSGT